MGDNLAALVRSAARSRPAAAALRFQNELITWAELDARVDRVAGALLGLGLTPGDRVGLQLGNTPDFPAVYFGTLRAGLVSVPLNTGFTSRELNVLLADSGARALVSTASGAGMALAARSELPALDHVIVGAGHMVPAGAEALADVLAAAAGDPVPDGGGGEDLAVLIYTSGTSGIPKGAMLSHRALLANLEQVSGIDPPVLGPDDVVLLVLPLFHIYGLNMGLGMTAYQAATAVLAERFDPYESLELIIRHAVTTVVGAPPMYIAWSALPETADAFGSVRMALSGSAPLPAGALLRLGEATGRQVFEGYGLTETAPVLTTTLISDVPKPDCIGRPIPGVEVKLVDDDGDEVDEDDPGELIVRGRNLFSGYWPDGADGPDTQGWFATGDVAYADEDTDLHLVGRRTDLIGVSGFNVYPREVEAVLLEHPAIAEAAVIAIPHPYTGQAVKAVVVALPGGGLTAEAVIAHCELALVRFKCPSTVEFVTELPHSAAGKVLTGQLRAQATERGPRVTVLSTRGCHLCERAGAAVARIAGELGVSWEYRDITDDLEALAEYGEQVPVILVDGEQHDFWRVDEARLRAALT